MCPSLASLPMLTSFTHAFCSAGMKTTLTMLICRSVTRPTPRSSAQSSPKHSRKHKRDLCLPKPAEQLPCVDALECYVLEQRTLY
ncbi:hypothetical protein BGY98DRAFT_1004536 [Russula aff. rugulosa BPL654]|nr:hypothetical protein BGY98DRAFT_1004536 [Russula aff. rugulosa BPL654]